MTRTLFMIVRALGAWALDILAPPTCSACDARLRRRAVFCGACAHAFVPAKPLPAAAGTPAIVAFAIYGGAIADALRKLKYAGRADLAGPLGDLAKQAARDAQIAADVVIPVPLHPARLAERGYNQASLIGAEIARAIGAPIAARALVRVRHTPQQARLDRDARHRNVEGAFRARSATPVRGLRVLLVDDVCTTGATLAACAAALREVGAIDVAAIVVARTDLAARDVDTTIPARYRA